MSRERGGLGEGRGWSYLSRAGQDAIVCRRLPARPDGDGPPCCGVTIPHSLAQVPARAGCAYGAQREGSLPCYYHARRQPLGDRAALHKDRRPSRFFGVSLRAAPSNYKP